MTEIMFPKDDRGIEFYDPAGEDNVKAPRRKSMMQGNKIGWIVYPSRIMNKVAEKYGYRPEQLLYELMTGELPAHIKEELDKKVKDEIHDA